MKKDATKKTDATPAVKWRLSKTEGNTAEGRFIIECEITNAPGLWNKCAQFSYKLFAQAAVRCLVAEIEIGADH